MKRQTFQTVETVMKKTSQEKRNFLNTYGGRTAVSAGAGALLGAVYERLCKKRERRTYLASILSGLLGGAAAGAGTLAFRRNVIEPTLRAGTGPSPETVSNVNDMVNRAVNDARKG